MKYKEIIQKMSLEEKAELTQFHPEKSGDTGLRILKAFAEL